MTFTLRTYDAKQDDLEVITRLLHRAYAPLKEQGMWFVVSEQSVEATRSRLEYGFAFVAVDDAIGAILGTITVYAPSPKRYCEWYRDTLWHFGQYAVDPDHQGRGIGAALVAHRAFERCGNNGTRYGGTGDGAGRVLHPPRVSAYRLYTVGQCKLSKRRDVEGSGSPHPPPPLPSEGEGAGA